MKRMWRRLLLFLALVLWAGTAIAQADLDTTAAEVSVVDAPVTAAPAADSQQIEEEAVGVANSSEFKTTLLPKSRQMG